MIIRPQTRLRGYNMWWPLSLVTNTICDYAHVWSWTENEGKHVHHACEFSSRNQMHHIFTCVKNSESFPHVLDMPLNMGCKRMWERCRSGEEKTVNAACFELRRGPFADSLLKLQRMSQRTVPLQEPLLLRVQSGFILSVLLRASMEKKSAAQGSLLHLVFYVRLPAELHGSFTSFNSWNLTK